MTLLTYLLTYLVYYAAEEEKKEKRKRMDTEMDKLNVISWKQRKAFSYYARHVQSIELIKDDCIQKVNFRVKDEVSFVC